ncbi:MAG: DUF2905 domain-containing protein [Chloroflexota bacterium]
MEDFATIGRLLIIFGLVLAGLGLLFLLAGRVPGLGRLPGDIVIQTDNITCFFPLATMILLSILLTVVLNIVARLFR